MFCGEHQVLLGVNEIKLGLHSQFCYAPGVQKNGELGLYCGNQKPIESCESEQAYVQNAD